MLSNQGQRTNRSFDTTIFWDIDGTIFREKLEDESTQQFNLVPFEALFRDKESGLALKSLMRRINDDLCRSRLNNFHACLTAKNKADAFTDYLAENFEDFFYTLNRAKNKKIKTASTEQTFHYYVTKQLQTIRVRPSAEPAEAVLESNTQFITPFIIANNLCANRQSTVHLHMKNKYPIIYNNKKLWIQTQNKLSGLLKVCEMEAYCQKTGIHPNCIILIDDAIEVVESARENGFIAIHFSKIKSFDALQTELLTAIEEVKANALKNKHTLYTNPSSENPPKITEEATIEIQFTLLKTIADNIIQKLKISTNSSSFLHTAATGDNARPNHDDLPLSKKARNV